MSLTIPPKPNYFIVDTSSERDTRWHDGALVYVKDITSLFILIDGSWITLVTGA